MADKYYVLNLDDPATPGFCSFNKLYVGTEETISMVMNNLEKAGHYPETVNAIKSYFKGDHSAEHRIAYRTQKVLVPIKIEAEHKTSFENKKWTHINIWGFPYEMKCDAALIHQIVFNYDGNTYRCVRAWLKNLCYESFGGNWNPLSGGFWGNDSILYVASMPNSTDFTFNNLLFVEEEHYENNVHSAVNDMLLDEKIEFKRICDEIFADG